MDSVSLLYWITRADAVCCMFMIFAILSLFMGIITFSCAMDECGEEAERGKKYSKILFTSGIILLILFVLTPSTKQAFIIYGVGNTIEYLKSNDKATGLPDKAILALDKYLDECIEDKDTTQTK